MNNDLKNKHGWLKGGYGFTRQKPIYAKTPQSALKRNLFRWTTWKPRTYEKGIKKDKSKQPKALLIFIKATLLFKIFVYKCFQYIQKRWIFVLTWIQKLENHNQFNLLVVPFLARMNIYPHLVNLTALFNVHSKTKDETC